MTEAASTSRPAGSPSTMVTSAGPCDSPAVRKRSMEAWYEELTADS
jgi:hypothetical protein